MRDQYRRQHLEQIVPDAADGSTPKGDWIQLVGAAYNRTIYVFEIQTTKQQDAALIQRFNSRSNRNHFNLIFHNCADFSRHVIDSYYPRAVHRSLVADVGIMTPKQAAKSLVHYAKKHPSLQFSGFAVAQIPGTVPRSFPVRGVLESLVKSKRYLLPLTSLAAVDPYVGGGIVFAWIEGGRFNPRQLTKASDPNATPATVAEELESNRLVPVQSTGTRTSLYATIHPVRTQ